MFEREGKMRKFEIKDLDYDNLLAEATCCEDWNKDLHGVARYKMAWLRDMMGKGLKAKLVYEGKKAVGFIEYAPIEEAPVAVEGKDITFINCIWIVTRTPDKNKSGYQGKGYGRALLRAAEQDVRESTRGIAVSAFDHAFWFTPASFFKYFDYKEVDRKNSHVLMFKAFKKGVKRPSFMKSKYKPPKIEPGKVIVEAFWNAVCPMGLVVMQRLREVVEEFGSEVMLREVFTDDRSKVKEYGVASGIFINGKSKFWGPPSKTQIRGELKKALKKGGVK